MQLEPPAMERDDLKIINTSIDFLGVNYYFRFVADGLPEPPVADQCRGKRIVSSQYTSMDWEVFPQALRDLLLRLKADYELKRIYITENGSAFPDHWDRQHEPMPDPERTAYLQNHLSALSEAIAQGVPVEGYFAWSLMDNYEWAYGYSKRFGLHYVDYPTQRRIRKASGQWYADFLAAYKENHP
jgi:beta-glucosidase